MAKRELDLLVQETEDFTTRENFDRIRLFVSEDLFTKFDGKLYELELSAAVTNFRFTHRLGFLPKDVILTGNTGVGSVTFNYSLFDSTHIDLTTTGAVNLRFVAGKFITNR